MPGMDDLASITASVTELAAGASLPVVPAIPQRLRKVRLGPDEMELPEFVALAGKLGAGALYLKAVPSGQATVDGHASAAAGLAGHKGEIGAVTVAFAANGLLHTWEQRTNWYQQELTAGEQPQREITRHG
jgi:hypothetical protein